MDLHDVHHVHLINHDRQDELEYQQKIPSKSLLNHKRQVFHSGSYDRKFLSYQEVLI